MNPEFVAILQKLTATYGREALLDPARAKAFIADYTGMNYKNESRLLLMALNTGVQKEIDTADNLSYIKTRQIKVLQEDHFLSEEAAANVVDTLALVLRGDTSKTTVKSKTDSGTPTQQQQAKPQAAPSSSPAKGKLTFDDGVYEGEIVNGKPRGKGKFIFNDGAVYEGDFVNGLQHGKGKMTYPDGAIYEGGYKDGQQHGKGKYKWPDGEGYEGDYVNGKCHGTGKYTYANGQVYEGDYVENIRHGKGKKTYPDGRVEDGKWENGKFVG
jgi:hypothetical protein